MRWRSAWLARFGTAPAWARAVAIGAVAAALAVLVLAGVVYTPGGGPVDERTREPGAGPAAEREAPGVARQRSAVATRTTPADSPSPAGTGPGSQPPEPVERVAENDAGVSGTGPGGGPPEATSSPIPTPIPTPTAVTAPPPVLTAQVATSDRLLLGLGGQAVTVTVANPGPGGAAGWEVIMDVYGQQVANVAGADYALDGSLAIFTPVDATLPEGASTQFSFDLVELLATAPSGCTIDGNPCG